MAHVFISYSSAHRKLTEELAAYLEGCGLDVWWDRDLVARGPFNAQIKEQLRTAGCILVIWTEGALTSEWVRIEADYARQHDNLVNVRAEEIAPERLPAPFNAIDAHRLSERDLILRDVLAVREGRLLLEDKREALPGPGERTPSMLLQAKYCLIPFTGSADIKAEIVDWALSRGAYTTPARRAAGRLIHASGGFGKTRLLIEVADELRQAGWSAGFLARPEATEDAEKRQRRAKALTHLVRGATDNGLLLVVDYAEARSEEVVSLARAIQSRLDDDKRPIRLVLLARAGGAWWERLTEDNPEVQGLMGGPRGLDARVLDWTGTGQKRLDLFIAAVSAFAGLLVEDGYQMPTEQPNLSRLGRIETGDGYDRPLAIIMEALLYVAAMAPGANEPRVHSLLASILGLERAHWKKVLGPLSPDSRGDPDLDLRRAVAQVSGVQGVVSRAAAEALFMEDRYYAGLRTSRSAVRHVTDNIAKVYGRGDGLVPLEPDLIAEHHVSLVADAELLDGCLAWIEDSPEKERDRLRQNLITVLQRATNIEHGIQAVDRACSLLDRLLVLHGEKLGAAIVAVMLETPGELINRLDSQINALSEPALDLINSVLPAQHIGWMELSLRIAQRYVDLNCQNGSKGSRKTRKSTASGLYTLGLRLANLGHRQRALAATQEAVDLYRALAIEEPNSALPELAGGLNALGTDFDMLGRFEESLAASQEAVDVYRTLIETKPDSFMELLAGSLDNLGNRLNRLGRGEDALAASHEAVQIYRTLAKQAPEDISADYAMTLGNFANRLIRLDRHPEALPVYQEAISTYRALASIRADMVLPDLARNLSNFGACLSQLGRGEEALPVCKEAVSIHRQLAEKHPEAFPDVAGSLGNLARILAHLGRHEEALVATQESVDILRSYSKDELGAFLMGQLAQSLRNLSIDLFNLGRREEALTALEEAVAIYRELATDQADAFLPDLATSLSDNSDLLDVQGRYIEATEASHEALRVLLPFAEEAQEAYGGLLGAIAHKVVTYSEKAGSEPDAGLLARVIDALGLDEGEDQ